MRKRKKSPAINWKWTVPVGGAILLAACLYAAGSSSADPQKTVARFQQAMEENDAKLLLSQIALPETAAERSMWTEDAASQMIAAVKASGKLAELVEGLSKEAEQYQGKSGAAPASSEEKSRESTFVLKKSGKKWMIFDDYKVQYTPAYAKTAVPREIALATDEQGVEIKQSSGGGSSADNQAYMIGPLLPGEHRIKAKMQTAFGEVESETRFTVPIGKIPPVTVNLETKEVKIAANLPGGQLYYQGNPLEAEFSPSWGSYTATIEDVPFAPLDFTLKVQTPFGELEQQKTLAQSDTSLEFAFDLTAAPQFKSAITGVLLEYEKAWIEFVKDKSGLKGLAPLLAKDSPKIAQFQREIAEVPKLIFDGKLTGLAINYNSATMDDPTRLQVTAKVTYEGKWMHSESKIVTQEGKEEHYMTFDLQLAGDSWKILDSRENYVWSTDKGTYEDVPVNK
ncbi:TcaA second domain-containing protein [Brevibacillus sp. B_LB10_24]|uniref:TcaA second domain-containing protein n=1 Tax=Brevibacillus sp. B_LB10_24 TaxID=3380645 RepID=UPI0038BA610F